MWGQRIAHYFGIEVFLSGCRKQYHNSTFIDCHFLVFDESDIISQDQLVEYAEFVFSANCFFMAGQYLGDNCAQSCF